MNYPHTNKIIIGLIIGLWGSLVMGRNQVDEDAASFDTLLPNNWYTKVLQSCMYVWTDLDAIITDDAMDTHVASYMIDAAVGRIMYCLSCVKKMPEDASIAIVEDDLLYLGRITVSLNNRCEKLVNDPAYALHAEVLKNVLVKFRTALTRALGR
jgi:hypothetical protein